MEISGESRGRARGARAPLFLDWSLLSKGLDDRPALLSQGLDPALEMTLL